MQQPQRPVEHIHQHATGSVSRRCIFAAQTGLAHLDVPVAVLAPEELVDLPSGLAQLVALDQARRVGYQGMVPADDPPVCLVVKMCRIEHARRCVLSRIFPQVAQHKSGSLPDLVAKVTVGLDAALGELHVIPWRRTGQQRKAQRIETVLLDDKERIIAPRVLHGLANLFTLLVAHQAVQIYRVEGHLPRKVHAHHDHPSDPEEYDVIGGLEH